jgi:hypothetical protein
MVGSANPILKCVDGSLYLYATDMFFVQKRYHHALPVRYQLFGRFLVRSKQLVDVHLGCVESVLSCETASNSPSISA